MSITRALLSLKKCITRRQNQRSMWWGQIKDGISWDARVMSETRTLLWNLKISHKTFTTQASEAQLPKLSWARAVRKLPKVMRSLPFPRSTQEYSITHTWPPNKRKRTSTGRFGNHSRQILAPSFHISWLKSKTNSIKVRTLSMTQKQWTRNNYRSYSWK